MFYRILLQVSAIILLISMLSGCMDEDPDENVVPPEGAYFVQITGDAQMPVLFVVKSASDVYSSLFYHASGSYVATGTGFTVTIVQTTGPDAVFAINTDTNAVVVSGDITGNAIATKVTDLGALAGSWTGAINKISTTNGAAENKTASFTISSSGVISSIVIDGLTGFSDAYAFLEGDQVNAIIRSSAADAWGFIKLGSGTSISTTSTMTGSQLELDSGETTDGNFLINKVTTILAPLGDG